VKTVIFSSPATYNAAALDRLVLLVNSALVDLEGARATEIANKTDLLALPTVGLRNRIYRLIDTHKLAFWDGVHWYYADGTQVT